MAQLTQVSAIVGGQTELDTGALGDLSEFFGAEEIPQIQAKRAYQVKGFWLKCLKDVEAVGSLP